MTEEAHPAPAISGPAKDESVTNGVALKAEVNGSETNQSQESPKPQRKRNKPSLSCETCTVSGIWEGKMWEMQPHKVAYFDYKIPLTDG